MRRLKAVLSNSEETAKLGNKVGQNESSLTACSPDPVVDLVGLFKASLILYRLREQSCADESIESQHTTTIVHILFGMFRFLAFQVMTTYLSHCQRSSRRHLFYST